MIDVNSDETEMACDVCLYQDDFDGDEIVICGLCTVAVHQSCYGSELISQDFELRSQEDWYCARCRELLKDPNSGVDKVACNFCPSVQGALKVVKYKGESIWAHISCVNWLCNIWFGDSEKVKITGEMKGF